MPAFKHNQRILLAALERGHKAHGYMHSGTFWLTWSAPLSTFWSTIFAEVVRNVGTEQSCRVQNEGELGRHVDKGGQQWIKEAKRSQAQPDSVNHERSSKVSHNDPMAPPGDFQCFDKLQKIIAEQHDLGTLSRDIRARSHRDAHIGLH